MNREEIQALIKLNYSMISRLESFLDREPQREFKGNCSVDNIINAVNEVFNTECRETTRRQRVILARHCAAYFLRKYTDLTLQEIAAVFSNVDHSTAHHGIKTCRNLIDTDSEYKSKVEKVKSMLNINFN